MLTFFGNTFTRRMLAKTLHDELSHQGITLVAVTKNQTPERVQPLYDAGLRDFGENRVQDLLAKRDALPKDVRWHLIGHLQTNKVKTVAPFVHLIHSVDSEKLLREISHQGMKANRTIDCLLQLRVAREETKFGWLRDDLLLLANEATLRQFPNVRVRGLMAMASNTTDELQIRNEFMEAFNVFGLLKSSLGDATIAQVDTLSMGMSGDYKIAVACGSNMVRVGSLLFES